MAIMKFGRHEIDINENDIILDNGACYQIATREVGFGFNSHVPIVSKKLFKELKTCGMVFTSEGLKQSAIQKYKSDIVTYWKFNMELIDKLYKQKF